MNNDKIAYPKTSEELLEIKENFVPKTERVAKAEINIHARSKDESQWQVNDYKTANYKMFEQEVADLERELMALELEKKNVIKPFYERRKKALARLLELKGEGYMWQDSETKIVLEVASQDGHYVYNEPFVINRTRFEDEDKGTLSMKRAREKGFTVEGK